MKLSAVIITQNIEAKIADCLESVGFCDEVVVIELGSTDKTVEVAKKSGAKVYKKRFEGDFSQLRNFGLSKSSNDWVLFVDSDERISRALRREIKELDLSNNSKTKGYYFKRRDHLWGKEIKYGEPGSVRLLRLADKNSGKWKRIVHETWNIVGEKRQLKNPILHFPHPTVSIFIKGISMFFNMHARANMQEGKKSGVFKIIFYPIFKFIYNYILRLGFLDGLAGLVVAIIMSFHSFLAWSSLWLMQKNK